MRNYYYFSLIFCLIGISFASQAQTPSPLQRKQKNRVLPPASRQSLESRTNTHSNSGHKYKSGEFKIHDSLKVRVRRGSDGNPLIIQGNPKRRKAKLSSREQIMQSCQDYLTDISGSTGITNPSDFHIIDIDDDQLGHKHVKLQQKHLGVDIYGAEVIVHFKNNEPHLFNGRYHKNTGLTDVAPVYSSAYAISMAMNHVSGETNVMEFTTAQRELLDYPGPGSELVIYRVPDQSAFNLAWHISVRPNMLELWEYFIDAKTGALLMKYNHTCSSGPAVTTSTDLNGQSRTINSYLVGSTYVLIDATKTMFNAAASTIPSDPVGAIWTLDAQNTDLQSVVQVTSGSNSWTQNETSAHYNAGLCYDYYKNTHARNSLDGQGGTIISVINVTDGGQPMDNAYWNGKFMAYGNGDVAFSPLAGGLDVAAHEMTHGVIGHTANLEYYQQSGAINESMADIFGCMVDRDDWQIGDDVTSTTYFPTGALRDVSDPHNGGSSISDNGWQPRTMSEYLNTSQDNGGVHINSGIPNYAFYLFATNASMNLSKAELIYYRALNNYLVRSSQFIDLRLAVVQAATDLYGTPEVNAAKAAFDAVGILDGSGGDYQNDVPVNNGQDYMLLKNTFSGDPNSLYMIDFAASSIDPLTTTSIPGKPSVTDNGTYSYFATGAGTVKRVSMNPSAPSETTIITDTDWLSVAVSKDGSKLAMVSLYQDTAIYVYDIGTATTYKYTLYNPTFSDGIVTDGPIYADAIEWDITGEYIIYDCYNKVENDTSNIDYWDIGFLKAWDNSTDSPGDGNIQKLFTNLPAGISVGNPTFSKNSPYIIAFDYIADNGSGYDYYVLGYNIETGDVGTIYANITLGFPSFSPDDNELAFSGYDGSFNPVIARIGLDSDKISSITGAVIIVTDAEVPVWFAKGNRTTGTTKARQNTLKANVYPNPTEDQFHLNYMLNNSNKVEITLVNALGLTVKTLLSDTQAPGVYDFDFSIADLNSGSYLVKIMSGEEFSTSKIVKIK
jgi:bacillolysin